MKTGIIAMNVSRRRIRWLLMKQQKAVEEMNLLLNRLSPEEEK